MGTPLTWEDPPKYDRFRYRNVKWSINSWTCKMWELGHQSPNSWKLACHSTDCPLHLWFHIPGTQFFEQLDFPGGSDGKASVYNAGDAGSIPGSGRFSWRRKWQSTPVLLTGKAHGQRTLVGYSPWGRKELGTTEWRPCRSCSTVVCVYWKKCLYKWTHTVQTCEFDTVQ